MKQCDGRGVLTNPERTIIYKARIIPHNYCIDPPKINERAKLLEDMNFNAAPPLLVVS